MILGSAAGEESVIKNEGCQSCQGCDCAGEEIKPNLVKNWFEKYPGIKMVNAYGPTEAADADFRAWVKGRHQTLAAVSEAWGREVRSWDATIRAALSR